ncbi:type II toxin-antitoxin system VapC family toxin [Azospirillum rugosum]|uniref:Nucleic acid-binding protein n=1 Tax=Azospirillum rugosum TaxID=416170 RepID=A0ABS4SVP5_9PROT|nr:type II toxin-antitoxin system VapC family toxin [Azospirillum rugosum]MBP2296630.1 putative nucleic acid-binding protein [Azospirillum rugosum]MDQ0530311.1 putative nucleic acid-binding protein [Azospirillum rugosum]
MNRLPSSIVADASVVAKWILEESDSERAKIVGIGRTLLAPEFLLVECANIFWKHERLGGLGAGRSVDALAIVQKAPFLWTSDADLVDDACRLSSDLKHPVYDCLYLALALRRRVPVVTADRRFAALAQKHGGMAEHLIALDSLA